MKKLTKLCNKHFSQNWFFGCLIVLAVFLTSCMKKPKNKAKIDEMLSNKFMAVEKELVAFKVTENTSKINFFDVIEKLGENSNISIFEVDENYDVKKIASKIDLSSKKFNINFSKAKNYLAIKPISQEIKARYRLLNGLKKIPNLDITPEICKYILCLPEVYQFEDVVQRLPILKQFRDSVIFEDAQIRYPPSYHYSLEDSGVCGQCLGNDIVFIDHDDIDAEITITPTELPTNGALCNCSLNTILGNYYVLKKLYEANPNNTLSWDLTDTSLRSFNGVKLDDNGNVERLNLYNSGLTTIPPEIGQLACLEYLNLSYNKIASIPPEIGRLTCLESLDLGDNLITTIPARIGLLNNLRSLYLDSNQITNIPSEIGGLAELKFLNLSNNQIIKIPVEIKFTALRDLDLSNNLISDIPIELWELRGLFRLDLSNNQITTNISVKIGQLRGLLELDLSRNQITGIPPQIGLTNLIELDLSSNQIEEIPEEIGLLDDLYILDLSNNMINIIPDEIEQIVELRWLNVSSNKIVEFQPEIGHQTQLWDLDLSYNEIANISIKTGQKGEIWDLRLSNNLISDFPAEIGEFTTLKRLSLYKNPASSIPQAVCDLADTGTRITFDDGSNPNYLKDNCE